MSTRIAVARLPVLMVDRLLGRRMLANVFVLVAIVRVLVRIVGVIGGDGQLLGDSRTQGGLLEVVFVAIAQDFLLDVVVSVEYEILVLFKSVQLMAFIGS